MGLPIQEMKGFGKQRVLGEGNGPRPILARLARHPQPVVIKIEHCETMSKPTALFIDGENISACHAPKILSFAPGAFIRRAYGDIAQIKNWGDVPSIRLIHSGTGKNASDLLLALDALEIAFEGLAERVVIASSDGDFTHLATRLREKGFEVIGIGEKKAPAGFRKSCSVFHEIGLPKSKPKEVAPPESKIGQLDHKIRQVIAQNSKEGRGMKIKDLACEMKKSHDVLISETPEKRWRPYLAGRPHLYDLDPKGPEAFVRYRAKGFAQLVIAAQ
ncbi:MULTISPECIES: NYN domain-containing protein [Thioclava]|nr:MULTISPECIES: NYN domain-containing protein [Thioclava]